MIPKSSALRLVIGFASAMASTSLAPNRKVPTEPPVPLKDIHDRGVEGRLGVRLGTIVEVSGEVIPNTSKAKADASEPFFLSIRTVNGKPLSNTVRYPFVKQSKWLEVATPRVGDKFRYVGFETGRFEGSPEGEFDYVPAYATTGYHFGTHFVVLAAKK